MSKHAFEKSPSERSENNVDETNKASVEAHHLLSQPNSLPSSHTHENIKLDHSQMHFAAFDSNPIGDILHDLGSRGKNAPEQTSHQPASHEVQSRKPHYNPNKRLTGKNEHALDDTMARFNRIMDTYVRNGTAHSTLEQESKGFVNEAIKDKETIKQAEDTINDVTSLVGTKRGYVNEALRINAAEGVLKNASDPSSIDQGFHSTCADTAFTNFMYRHHSDVAADMTKQVLLTGKYVAPDQFGNKSTTLVDKQSLTPGAEEKNFPADDGRRNYATQVANVTELNYIGQQNIALDNGYNNNGSAAPLRFLQRSQSASSTGEYWADMNGNVVSQFTGTGMDQVATMQKALTKDDTTAVYAPGAGNNVVPIDSANTLSSFLANLKNENKLPAVVAVRAGDPVISNGRLTDDGQLDHAVCISNYDEKNNMVYVDNQWGQNFEKWVPLTDLYEAMTFNTQPSSSESRRYTV